MSDEFTPQLIKQLEAIKDNSLRPLERRLVDTAVWFHKNKDRVPREDLPKRLDFLEKCFDIMLELVALTVERQQHVEGRRKGQSLYFPDGCQIEDDDGNVQTVRYR